MMDLAERLGMTFGELGERMGSEEVTMWLAKDRITPPPDPWLMVGLLASLIANAANALGGGKKKFTPEDFMPRSRARQPEPHRQTPEEMLATIKAINAAAKARGG